MVSSRLPRPSGAPPVYNVDKTLPWFSVKDQIYQIYEYRFLSATDDQSTLEDHMPSAETLVNLTIRATQGHQIIIESRETLDSLHRKFSDIPNVILVADRGRRLFYAGRQYDLSRSQGRREQAIIETILALCEDSAPQVVQGLVDRLASGDFCEAAIDQSPGEDMRRRYDAKMQAQQFKADSNEDRAYYSDEGFA